jgi:hypothetical protein
MPAQFQVLPKGRFVQLGSDEYEGSAYEVRSNPDVPRFGSGEPFSILRGRKCNLVWDSIDASVKVNHFQLRSSSVLPLIIRFMHR